MTYSWFTNNLPISLQILVFPFFIIYFSWLTGEVRWRKRDCREIVTFVLKLRRQRVHEWGQIVDLRGAPECGIFAGSLCCVHGKEKLLVYEYVPHDSLFKLLFNKYFYVKFSVLLLFNKIIDELKPLLSVCLMNN